MVSLGNVANKKEKVKDAIPTFGGTDIELPLKDFLKKHFRPARYRAEQAIEELEEHHRKMHDISYDIEDEIKEIIRLSEEVESEIVDPSSIESDFVTFLGHEDRATEEKRQQIEEEAAEIADSIEKLMRIKELTEETNQKLQKTIELSENLEQLEESIDEAAEILAFGLDRVEGEIDGVSFPDEHYPHNYGAQDIRNIIQRWSSES